MEPTASWMSILVTARVAFVMIRLAVSPIPIGRTPGFLLRAMRRQARKGVMREGSTKLMQRRLVTSARDWQRSLEADLNEVHSLLQQRASKQEGPAAPDVRKAIDLIREASMDSNRTGCVSGGGSEMIESG